MTHLLTRKKIGHLLGAFPYRAINTTHSPLCSALHSAHSHAAGARAAGRVGGCTPGARTARRVVVVALGARAPRRVLELTSTTSAVRAMASSDRVRGGRASLDKGKGGGGGGGCRGSACHRRPHRRRDLEARDRRDEHQQQREQKGAHRVEKDWRARSSSQTPRLGRCHPTCGDFACH